MPGNLRTEVRLRGTSGANVRALTETLQPGDSHLFERISQLEAEKRELEILNAQLQLDIERFARQALIDPLTGLANRRYVNSAMDRQISAAGRTGQSLALLLCDIDNFKHYNDSYGHSHGDSMLVHIGALLRRFCWRKGECAARYGGEEFALLLPGNSASEAVLVAERIRKGIAALSIGRMALSVTVSIGVTNLEGGAAAHRRQLIEAADAALYRAKRCGRNRTKYQQISFDQ